MSHKVYDNLDVRGTVSAEAPASTGVYRILVFNTTSKVFESVDPSEIGGGGGLGPGCYAACGIVEGRNHTQEFDAGDGIRYWLRYRVGDDDGDETVKTTNIVESNSREIQYPLFAGAQPGYLYMLAELVLMNKYGTEDVPPTPTGRSVALIVTVNGYVVFARTISSLEIGDYLDTNPIGPWIIPFEAWNPNWEEYTATINGPEWGYVIATLVEINNDTNLVDSGILAMGQDILFESDDTIFNARVQTVGGGWSSEDLEITKAEPADQFNLPEAGFSWRQFGSTATSGNLIITGQNSEAISLFVQGVASFDESLAFYEEVLPGASYSKTLPITQLQLQDNDFYVNITKGTPPEEPEED